MTKINFGDKELNIKYGYAATVKSGIIADLMSMDKIGSDMDSVEKILMFMPKLLLVGLQKNHKDEYGCNLDSEDDTEKAMDKVYDLLDDYFENDGDVQTLFMALQEELMSNGFLSKMARGKKKVKAHTQEVPEKVEN